MSIDATTIVNLAVHAASVKAEAAEGDHVFLCFHQRLEDIVNAVFARSPYTVLSIHRSFPGLVRGEHWYGVSWRHTTREGRVYDVYMTIIQTEEQDEPEDA
jgi:hypothetical protein